MTKTYLLEIGLEEMPAHVVRPSVEQLAAKTKQFLQEQRLDFKTIKTFATPRRLAIQILDLADQQKDEVETVRGPARRIAVDDQGNYTKAALGFMRGQKVQQDDLTFKPYKNEPYLFAVKKIKGEAASVILPKLKAVITNLTFPTKMRWNSYHFEYIRPLHWLVSLLDDQIVPIKILDIEAGRKTPGHRFLGQTVTLQNANDYEEALTKVSVIADMAKREQMITDQIKQLVADHDWQVDLDPDLLEEVVNLVEYPTAFAGTFSEKYLRIPEQVLITSMKDNQRYFEIRTATGQLAPHFIGVRDGNRDHLENVIAGNEKVLAARLADAQFFYDEDQKHSISEDVEKLKKVSFHDQIGTMYEKMQRVQVIAQVIGKEFALTKQELKDLHRASEIYKFDLVTDMVGEFPELQGVMGEIYARNAGENPAVAQAIREHYLPTSAHGPLPQSRVGATLALADKIDTIIAFFAIGLVPSGSNDPYALRRQAAGIVRILIDQNWHLSLSELQPKISSLLGHHQLTFNLNWEQHQAEIRQFFLDRLRQLFGEHQVAHDLIDTVSAVRSLDPTTLRQVVKALQKHRHDPDFKETIEALTRVIRLVKQNKIKFDQIKVDPELFEHPSERELYEAVQHIQQDFGQQTLEHDFDELRKLGPVINRYFDENMIMADDPKIRDNRLKQLIILQKLIQTFGDLRELIVK